MKIAIIQPRVSYYNGGGEIFPMQFIIELTKRTDIEINLYTLKSPTKETQAYIDFKNAIKERINIFEYQVPENFRYLYEIDPGQNRYRWDAESIYFSGLIFPDLIKNKEDLIWSYYNFDSAIHPINTPSVLNILGYPSANHPSNARALFDQFTATISISKNVADKWENIIESKLKNNFVPCPVVAKIKDPIENKDLFNEKNINIVFAGRLIERKGLRILIKAISLLEEIPNIKLSILGEGPFKSDLIKLINDLRMEQKIEFLGYKENTSDYFLNADICVFPSESGEGLMGVVLEAMYCGGVVITTSDNGNEEILENNKHGLIVEPKNEISLAESIKFVINNPDWASLVRKNAKNHVRENFTWERYVKEIENFIKVLV